MANYNAEQVLAMAPDAGSAKAGQALGNPGKWSALGCSPQAVWGACQGSGAKPYEVTVDLSEPAFRCSCPSRKFPCKHCLGLLLLHAAGSIAHAPEGPPPFAAEWLGKRTEKAVKQAEAIAAPKTEADTAKAAEDQAKRAAQRDRRVHKGIEDFRVWLYDLARQGIASMASRPYRFFDEPAARLVDAQAPGVAAMVRSLAVVAVSNDGNHSRLVERIGAIHLLLEAFDRIESLPEPVQADVRAAIGWNVRQDEVLAGEGIADCWCVAGCRTYDEDHIRVNRSWLIGRRTGRSALILQFTRPGQAPDDLLIPGFAFDGELAFYSSAWPIRAAIKSKSEAQLIAEPWSGAPDFSAMLDACSAAIAASPWITVYPAAVAALLPVQSGNGWELRDRTGAALPICKEFQHAWKLMGMSCGRSVDLFAEFVDGELLPLSAWSEGRLISLA